VRTLRRNRQEVLIGRVIGEEPIYDEWGEETGETRNLYEIETTYMNHTPIEAKVIAEAFGANVKHDRTVYLAGNPNVERGDVMWLDTLDRTKPPEYTVVDIARTLNGILVGVRKEAGHA